ncbi:hypothetical protein UK23_42555 [Lentzea aerocolonigenes]|uniref:PIN domain-containing protein n=1 Tax=Lentzea aerocolonigenes TaxID=68170 RepID=A0A0F0GHG6_LENAE|nr:hypothetical protein [Lentzea aerocolonigenes]KJK35827.1 hypothetical protein UK23_42555 [Lentzea aerocolonigenes]
MADELIWAQVMRPRIPLVYLDLNHIVAMARVRTGHPKAAPAYRRLFESARRAATERRAVFPLSESHVWEISKIADPKQRGALSDVLELLTGYQYMLDRPTLGHLEFIAGIAAITGEPLPDELGHPLIRSTIGHAFGMIGGLKIVDEHSNDKTEDIRRAAGAAEFDHTMAELNYKLEHSALRGPADDEIEVLRSQHGYRPEVALASHESRVDFERETGRFLAEKPKLRRGRLRDLVAGREFVHEWLGMFTRVQVERLISGQPAFDPTNDQMRALVAAMPHAQVAISMKTRFHKNPAHVWKSNHVTDIDAVSVAYAYCEAVFTDKEMRSALLDSPELRVLGTFVPRHVEELVDWLDQLPIRIAPDLVVPHPLVHTSS